jgi:hypothetical protein
VRVLFDQGVPAPLRRHLAGHIVSTAYEQGWSTLRNGELLAAAELAAFDVFVTTDKNLRYQQDISGRHLAIVVLGTTSWVRIERHVEGVLAAIGRCEVGAFAEIDIPK